MDNQLKLLNENPILEIPILIEDLPNFVAKDHHFLISVQMCQVLLLQVVFTSQGEGKPTNGVLFSFNRERFDGLPDKSPPLVAI